MSTTNETLQSSMSYGAGAGGLFIAHFAEAAQVAQHLTIFIALLVVIVRLVYDVTRLRRYLKDKNHDKSN